jgi:hypothetical protein
MAFSDEQIKMARQTDLISYLDGENKLAREEGRIEPYLLEKAGNQVRVRDYSGLLVKDNMWNQRGTGNGGNTVDFLQQFEKRSFKEAVERLLKNEHGYERVDVAKRVHEPKVPFVLPERNETFRRAIAYLTKTRGLDGDIVLKEIKKEISMKTKIIITRSSLEEIKKAIQDGHKRDRRLLNVGLSKTRQAAILGIHTSMEIEQALISLLPSPLLKHCHMLL